MSDERADVLARGGNVAVTRLAGRAFPGVHIQGDTFAELVRQAADAARQLRRDPSDGDALEDLDDLVGELIGVREFYEATLAERGIDRPYV
ncbi:DUF6959 family protein [Actinoplanes sp. HUAS TT8]|uniref:DUF6959 family protein n=1 Tax=Actinoplanes sp. HUAS TT8 TaxID=3447453 RepID=UPI003F522F8F